MKCKICGNENNNKTIMANEMRVNQGNRFEYLECGHCGCIQLVAPPDSFDKYYNEGYYSYNDNSYNPIKRKLIQLRNNAYYNSESGMSGRILKRVFPMKYDFKVRMDLIDKYAIDKKQPIVDVGCGAGHLVDMISDVGYENVSGCDPYLMNDCMSTQGNKLYKREIFGLEEKYQIISMIHSLEHMSNPIEVVEKASQLLVDNGTLIIEVPVLGYVWKKYGLNWVQFDSPVHFFLHTEKSILELCNIAKMRLVDTIYKGTDYQFRGSELLEQGIWIDKQSRELFDRYANRQRYFHYAELLNEMGLSDTAVFVLKNE